MEAHEEINSILDLKINEERIKKLQKKQKPKTKIQRMRGFFLLLLGIGLLCQFISALLASSGVMYYLSTKLNDNGFIIAATAICLLICLEAAKRFTLESYHHQRLDDKHVNKITYVFIVGLMAISAISTYIGTPHAVEFFASGPVLNDIELLRLEQNKLIQKDTSYWSSKKIQASSMAMLIHEQNSWKGKTSREARPVKLEYETAAKAAQDSLNTKLMQGQLFTKEIVKEAETENTNAITKHLVWCDSFGSGLAALSIFLELLFFAAMFWCEGYNRLEVTEAKEILKLQDKDIKEVKPKAVVKAKEQLKTLETSPLTTIGFNSPLSPSNTKEGQIIKGQGSKVDRVAVLKRDGTLKLYTKGGINNLIKVSSPERSMELEALKNKLS